MNESTDAEDGQATAHDDTVVHKAKLTDDSVAVIRRALRDQQHKSATSEEWDALDIALDELPEEITEEASEFAKEVLV